MSCPDDTDGMVKTGVNENAEARAAAAELRRRLADESKTASPAARKRLQEQLAEAERKLE